MSEGEGFETLAFICTDRGQHPERTVAVVWDDLGLRGGITPDRPGREPLEPTWKASGGAGLAMSPCPTCGRDVRLSAERVRAIWDAGLRRVDASNLP